MPILRSPRVMLLVVGTLAAALAVGGLAMLRHPEPFTPRVEREGGETAGEYLRMFAQRAARTTGPGARPSAYAAAVRVRERMADQRATIPGNGAAWTPLGKGPLIFDDPDTPEVNGLGLRDVMGRINDYAWDPAKRRIYAAVATGGVWVSDDLARTWRSIGETLPSQVVGSVGFSPADGGTLIVSTGDSVYGGGLTFSGIGVYRSTDQGATWTRADGVPSGYLSFKVAVDPTDPQNVYVATGSGLYRSTDAAKSFVNVALPTGRTDGKRDGAPLNPNCTGDSTKPGCFLANIVTDVVVQPKSDKFGKPGGRVLATVGWRAGDKESAPSKAFPDGYVESPNNGIYVSSTGAPGTFEKTDQAGFASQPNIGRIEVGLADGPAQNPDYVYAIVEDAQLFNRGFGNIDAPENNVSGMAGSTLEGIYVSPDFGRAWSRMESGGQLALDPTSGSALIGTASGLGSPPGVQAWYNLWIKPDPTRATAAGVPTRLTFGLEEIFQNEEPAPPTGLTGPTKFKVIGRYYAGNSCLFLSTGPAPCPTDRENAAEFETTTHPDQHGVLYVPNPDGSAGTNDVLLVAGNDGGNYLQAAAEGQAFNNNRWGRGNNDGFNTLLSYDAQIAADGTVWTGLQDNGEAKILPDGRQLSTFGGDGGFSAVDPNDSNIAYEALPTLASLNVTTNGGKTWTDTSPPTDTYQFIQPFTMDPEDAKHLVVAGTRVHETLDGPETRGNSWKTVFDLGTRTKPGDPDAAPSATDANNTTTAIDVRGANVYVGFCGRCEVLNTRGFGSGLATNVAGELPPKPGSFQGWHIAAAKGLPKRYITSVQMDPAEPRTIYVTLGGYSRRWLPVGALDEADGGDVGGGHVFKSTDAGETFRNVSGNLPDAPANWSLLRNGRLVVATDVGVFIADDAEGTRYELLGTGLPAVPAVGLELQPGNPNRMIVATMGRGVYAYEFPDRPAAPATTPGGGTSGGSTRPGGTGGSAPGTDAPGGGSPEAAACSPSTGFKSVRITPRGRGLRFAFTRKVERPVTVWVFQTSAGRRVLGERMVARFTRRSRSFNWNGAGNRRHPVTDGFFFVRLRMDLPDHKTDIRRIALRRSGGRFAKRPGFYRRESCGLLTSFKLQRNVFGGGQNREVGIAFRLSRPATVQVQVLRGKRVVQTFRERAYRAGRFERLVLYSEKRPRGDYRIRLRAREGSRTVVATLTAHRL